MARFKAYDYRQRVFLPVSLEDQLIPGTLEFAIHTLVEDRLDTSRFEERYRNDETGRVAYDPKILLKIVLLGYARGLISSRKIEQACQENVVFIALACGQQPDHSTIATFVSSMKAEILPLFRDVLLVCQEMDLLGGTFFALDGLKLPSHASKEWSGTRSELHRKKERLEAKVSCWPSTYRRITETIPLQVREAAETESDRCSVCRSKPNAWRSGSRIMTPSTGPRAKRSAVTSRITSRPR